MTAGLNDDHMITFWGAPDEKLDSGYGAGITYRRWCELEIERFKRAGCVVKIVSRGDKIALYRS